MTRFDPDAAPPPDASQLAPPTMERGQHFLFHSKPGDIWGAYTGPASDPAATLTGNLLIVAQCSLMREAKRILAELQAVEESGFAARAKITAWLKGEKSRSMWAVHVHDVTPADVDLARPFSPPLPVSKSPRPAASIRSATEKRVSLTRFESGTRNADIGKAASAQRTERTAPPQSVTDRVTAMPVTTFAFLISTDDLDAAAMAQRCFIQHLESRRITKESGFAADWRAEWSRWWATQNAPRLPVSQSPSLPVSAAPPVSAESTSAIAALRNRTL